MTRTTADNMRDDYLARLDEAMRGLPHGVAAEIRGGIAEELEGLDPAATTERIARLGDPEAIAREAHEAQSAEGVAAAAAMPEARIPAMGTRGFAVAAALTLSFGGFVVPIVGWFVGAVLVSLSSVWRTAEKVVAIVVPFVLCTLSGILVSAMGFSSWTSIGGSDSSEGINPLVPAWYDLIWFGAMLLGVVLIPLSGLWLLWRLRGRAAR